MHKNSIFANQSQSLAESCGEENKNDPSMRSKYDNIIRPLTLMKW